MAIFKKKEKDAYNELDAKKNASNVSDGMLRFNRVSPFANAMYSALFIFIAAICVLPVIFVIIISFTSEQAIGHYGYSFFPKELSIASYEYVWGMRSIVGRAFFNSIGITIFGTCLGVVLTATMPPTTAPVPQSSAVQEAPPTSRRVRISVFPFRAQWPTVGFSFSPTNIPPLKPTPKNTPIAVPCLSIPLTFLKADFPPQ